MVYSNYRNTRLFAGGGDTAYGDCPGWCPSPTGYNLKCIRSKWIGRKSEPAGEEFYGVAEFEQRNQLMFKLRDFYIIGTLVAYTTSYYLDKIFHDTVKFDVAGEGAV